MTIAVVKEPLRVFGGAPVESRQLSSELIEARHRTLSIIDRNLAEFGERFPAEACVNGYYPLTENVEWTTSFWTGQLWLAWELSGKEAYRQAALRQVRSFGVRIAGRQDTDTHDLGFLYTLFLRQRLAPDRQRRGARLCVARGTSAIGTVSRARRDHSSLGGFDRPAAGRAHDH